MSEQVNNIVLPNELVFIKVAITVFDTQHELAIEADHGFMGVVDSQGMTALAAFLGMSSPEEFVALQATIDAAQAKLEEAIAKKAAAPDNGQAG